jgi:hypothetical protein
MGSDAATAFTPPSESDHDTRRTLARSTPLALAREHRVGVAKREVAFGGAGTACGGKEKATRRRAKDGAGSVAAEVGEEELRRANHAPTPAAVPAMRTRSGTTTKRTKQREKEDERLNSRSGGETGCRLFGERPRGP